MHKRYLAVEAEMVARGFPIETKNTSFPKELLIKYKGYNKWKLTEEAKKENLKIYMKKYRE